MLLRTLSKFVSLAGVRCGLLIAAPPVIEFSQNVLPPYTFPTPSIEHVVQALSTDSLRVSEERVALLKRERARLAAALAELPQVRKVYPSDANFVMVKARDGAAFRETAHRGGVLVRDIRRSAARGLRADHGRHARATTISCCAPSQARRERAMRKVLFVDRDGTLIEDDAGKRRQPGDVRLDAAA